MSPLLVQGTLWLSASIGLLASQLLLLMALHGQVRYVLTRDLRWATATAGGILGATLFGEQAAVTALVLPILTIGFLQTGQLRKRIRATLALWPGWAMIAVPLIAFLYYVFVFGDYGDAAQGLRVWDAIKLVTVEWTASIAPALVGGPWIWVGKGDNYLALADPVMPLRIACVIALAVIVAIGIRRTGLNALLAWSMPLLTSGVGILIVGSGRYQVLGLLIAKTFEHAYFTALPAALAVTISLWRVDPSQIRERISSRTRRSRESPARHEETDRREDVPHRAARVVAAIAVAVVALGSITSGITYTMRWSQSPARSYLHSLLFDLKKAGGAAALYDTAVNPAVIPGIVPAHNVSDLLHLAGARPATDVVRGPRPMVVGLDGHFRRAGFFVIARASGQAGPGMHPVGAGSRNLASHTRQIPEWGTVLPATQFLPAAPVNTRIHRGRCRQQGYQPDSRQANGHRDPGRCNRASLSLERCSAGR